MGCLSFDREARLALEPAEDLRVLGLGRRQHLDGDDLAERMLGLVDAGHAALAEPVEDLVFVEEEAVGVAARQQRRLVLGHEALGHHPLGELAGVGRVLGLALPAGEHGVRVGRREQPAANEQAVDILHREFHASSTSRGTVFPHDTIPA